MFVLNLAKNSGVLVEKYKEVELLHKTFIMELEFINEKGVEYVIISNQAQLKEIIKRIAARNQFAYRFKFSERHLFITLIQELKINYEDFTDKYYFYDPARKLHISESEFGYVWISTSGLVASRRPTTNRAVNSCLNQHIVISMLIEKAIEVVKDESVLDADSYNFDLLNNLSPAIYQNIIFYIEVFCKAYLSLTGTKATHTHSLTKIYQTTVEIMRGKNHDDSLFQVIVLEPLYKFVDHVSNIPGEFKEHFIKYDDNLLDDTVILFDLPRLYEMISLLEISVDFISDYYYIGSDTYYLKSNLFERMLEKADTQEKKEKIKSLYPHLAKEKLNFI